jgi:hypothetical protein
MGGMSIDHHQTIGGLRQNIGVSRSWARACPKG